MNAGKTRSRSSVVLVVFGLLGCGTPATEGLGTPAVRESALTEPLPTDSVDTPPVADSAVTPPRLVPRLPSLAGIVKNEGLARVLGKAFFWDQQVGSDGAACASCHFHAGADTRITNQLNPGFNNITKGPSGDTQFGADRSSSTAGLGKMPSGAIAGPNYTVVPGDFPLHRLADETVRDSAVLSDTDDVVGSVGAFDAAFIRIMKDGTERCGPANGSIFHVGKFASRQTEARHTPTTINAVLNIRNFWDSRANNLFNGVGVFGLRDIAGDPNKRLIVLDGSGTPGLGYLQITDASLASQAVAPPINTVEMSCSGRTFPDLGRKLLASDPLALQKVDPDDSILGPYARSHGQGLARGVSYKSLIQNAFEDKFWAAPGTFRIRDGALKSDGSGYTQMETNMSMFWGISIMLYEQTLISDRSEFDTLVQQGAITISFPPPAFLPDCSTTADVEPLLARGCKIFTRAPFGPPPTDGQRGVGCAFCHGGTTFSEAAAEAGAAFPALLQVTDVNNAFDTRDLGFATIGIRPAFTDRLLGGTDPYGNPLSFGRQYRAYLDTGDPSKIIDPFLQQAIATGTLVLPPTTVGPFQPDAKLENDGASKVPSMRNVALTPPYFSYGGYASLRQVLKFYNRGGNRRQITGPGSPEAHGSLCSTGDDTGSGPDGNHPYPVTSSDCNTNTTGLLVSLGLSDCDANGTVTCDTTTDDLSAVVRFLQSLTDPRVQCDRAPFDHPQLFVTNGHSGTDRDHDGRADDNVFAFPAIGGGGYAARSGYCIPNAGDLFAPGMQARSGGPKAF